MDTMDDKERNNEKKTNQNNKTKKKCGIRQNAKAEKEGEQEHNAVGLKYFHLFTFPIFKTFTKV